MEDKSRQTIRKDTPTVQISVRVAETERTKFRGFSGFEKWSLSRSWRGLVVVNKGRKQFNEGREGR